MSIKLRIRGDFCILRRVLVILLLSLWLWPAAGKTQEIYPQVSLNSSLLAGRETVEIRVNDLLALRIRTDYGGLARENRAKLVARRIRNLPQIQAGSLTPAFENGEVVVKAGPHLIVTVDEEVARLNRSTRFGLAYVWANRLRQALGAPPLPWSVAELLMLQTSELPTREGTGSSPTGSVALPVSSVSGSRRTWSVTGIASWYGPGFHGNQTANGEIFNQFDLTAAHRTLPFGSWVRVTNLENGKMVVVRVNDRGPFVPGRIIDLSYQAARAIGLDGLALVRLDVYPSD